MATLRTSHTHCYSKGDPKRYQLLGVFNALYEQDREDLFVYDGIGIDTRNVDGQIIIVSVFDGFPAQKAGLRFGGIMDLAALAVDNQNHRRCKMNVSKAVDFHLQYHQANSKKKYH